MPPRKPKLTQSQRDLMKPVPASQRTERDWEAFGKGYRSYAQMERIRLEVAEERPRVATAYVTELYETGEIVNLEMMFRDLYEYYAGAYEDRDELVDALREIVSPTAE